MKIAIFGGTFNPVHTGHMLLADSVCKILGYDKVLFVPSFLPPHKFVTQFISVEDRLQMLRLACEDDSRFEVESCEIDRGGISYTWDTVCCIEEKYAKGGCGTQILNGKLGLIIGQDLSAEFGKWKNAAQLAEKTDLILAHRPKEDNLPQNNRGSFTGTFASEEMLNSFPYPHKIIDNPLFSVSSTEIRKKIEKNEDFSGLVPEKVYCYIKQRKLYGYRF